MANFTTVEDFAADESFQDFVLDKSVQNVDKWQKYLIDNPEKHKLLTEASILVKSFSPGDVISIKKNLVAPSIKQPNYKPLLVTSVLLFLLLTFSILVFNRIFDADQTVRATYVAYDEVAQFDLPDGTIAVLKPASRLQIVGDWSKTRLCHLSGDVFLDVSPGKKKFILKTDEDKVTVLGTKFAINTSHGYEIVLEEGKIQHESDFTDPVILKKNQLLRRKNSDILITKADAKRYNFWKNEKLAFKDERLENIVDILVKSYGLSIQLENSNLENKIISAQIPRNNPELLLKAIAEIYEINLVSENETYILR